MTGRLSRSFHQQWLVATLPLPLPLPLFPFPLPLNLPSSCITNELLIELIFLPHSEKSGSLSHLKELRLGDWLQAPENLNPSVKIVSLPSPQSENKEVKKSVETAFRTPDPLRRREPEKEKEKKKEDLPSPSSSESSLGSSAGKDVKELKLTSAMDQRNEEIARELEKKDEDSPQPAQVSKPPISTLQKSKQRDPPKKYEESQPKYSAWNLFGIIIPIFVILLAFLLSASFTKSKSFPSKYSFVEVNVKETSIDRAIAASVTPVGLDHLILDQGNFSQYFHVTFDPPENIEVIFFFFSLIV